MAIKSYKPVTAAQRALIAIDRSELWKGSPLKILTKSSKSKAGRNNKGQITVRRRGGGHKQAGGFAYELKPVVENIIMNLFKEYDFPVNNE